VKDWQKLRDEIKQIYLADKRPWVIGYSGGKDSTTSLQLVWEAISQLPVEKRKKQVYVISSDTLVETPVIVDFINQTLSRINEKAAETKMPFQARKVRPVIRDSFWVNLIGRGYPAPSNTFRWCTDRLKIRPSNSFILKTVSRYGEVILVLGVRSAESQTRAHVIKSYQIQGSPLSRHSRFSGAYVYAPIKTWTIDDVWDYLLTNKSPLGNDNRELVQLYRKATGECPLVVDDTTPPCGNSRFGCWTCTVVRTEKSITSLIESGEKWMLPLLEFRNFLVSTQDPEVKADYREYKRRQGMVSFKSDGSGVISRGPYTLEVCKELLKRLLSMEKQIREKGPDPNIHLILPEELQYIRRIWRIERGDWIDSVPKIYRDITGSDLDWVKNDVGAFTSKEKALLEGICIEQQSPPKLVMKLLDAELQTQGMRRRSSIYNMIDSIFNEEWRSEDEVIRAYEMAHPQKVNKQ